MLDGFLNVYKEQGYTSFDVVAKLRGILKQKKIGHTATTIQENVDDIYQGAKQINADREAEEDVVVEDIPAETAEETAECACEAAAENTEAVEA